MEDNIFKGTEGITSANKNEWYKIFKSYANVCEKFFQSAKYEDCTKVGFDAIQIYNSLVEVLKKEAPKEKYAEKYPELDIKKVYKNMGSAYRAQAESAYDKKNYLEALNLSKNALLYNQTDVLIHFILAKTLAQLGAAKEAADSYETVMVLDKNYNEGRRLLGDLYRSDDLMDYDKSISNYQAYLANAKNDKSTWLTYSGQCYKIGLHKECLEACEALFKLDPAMYKTIVVYMLTFLKVFGYSQKEIKNITEKIVKRHIKSAYISRNAFRFNNRDKNPNRKIKIGYLSSDLYNHVVSRFMLPIIENHDKENFEINLYAVSDRDDYITKKYKEHVDNFYHCNKMSDNDIAKKIYEDKIDILIDLNVHTGDGRTMVMAQKPAPVQCIYLGYPNTSGIKEVDYILTDKYTIYEGEEELYTEKPAYIEAGYEVIDTDYSTLPDITDPPYLKNKYVTMGVFNAVAKVNNEMIKVWAEILKKSKKTKILFQYINYYTGTIRKRITTEFEKYGINKDRIIFMGKAEKSHYNSIAMADFTLDTFPYSGTGTTMDSILMGLPVVCFDGYHATSRPTSRILKYLGEEELIAKDNEEYVQKALELINNPTKIAVYRETLREKLNNSPLTDYRGFTRSLEKTYREIWQNYCNPAPEQPLEENTEETEENNQEETV